MPSSTRQAVRLPPLLMLLLLLLLAPCCVDSLIVPEELPTILSLIYSNIPPVKKGTDSRLGVGFRLGEHADFQVILELGPQKETDPIGNAVDSKRKRAALMGSALKGELGPWAQAVAKYQIEQKIKTMMEKHNINTEKPIKVNSNPDKNNDNQSKGSEWLSKWSQGLVANPDDTIPLEEVSTRKSLPNINRLRVVNSQTDDKKQKDMNNRSDLENLKKLFSDSNGELKSVK